MASATAFHDLFDIDTSYYFEFEDYIQYELHINLQKPPEICKVYQQRGSCPKGSSCPLRHVKDNDKMVVCKHWLRGLCKKGDMCEFLHQYNLKKMPECWFFTKFGECSNPECMYRHIDPNSKMRDCAWYARGFCKHGPHCRHKHVRKAICQLYITGFCPKGPECPFGHPKYELPNLSNPDDQHNMPVVETFCPQCQEKGHLANQCPKKRKLV